MPQSKMSRLDLNACACTARLSTWAGRYLLIMSALSILTMPITEHFWTWDRFLQTGRDFELGTLLVLMLLCLVLVLSKQRMKCVESFLSLCEILALQFAKSIAPLICLSVTASIYDSQPVTGTGTALCGFPLQI